MPTAIPEETVRLIRAMKKRGAPYKQITDELGVSSRTVATVCRDMIQRDRAEREFLQERVGGMHHDGMSHKQIAEALGIPVKTVSHYARVYAARLGPRASALESAEAALGDVLAECLESLADEQRASDSDSAPGVSSACINEIGKRIAQFHDLALERVRGALA